jgi:hypothetical protein
MASVRLTDTSRSEILKRALQHAFGKRQKALGEEEHKLALKVYEHVYPKKHRELMAQLPRNYFSWRGNVYCYAGGEGHSLTFEQPKPFGDSVERASFGHDEALGQAVVAFARKKESLKREIDQRREEVRAVLSSVTTLARLLEVWPEIETFTKGIAAAGSKPVTALAIPIRDLNVHLGLPPGARS